MTKDTLLLIDDDEDMLSVTRIVLEGAGFSVLSSSNGLKGIELYSKNCDIIKAVLIDLIMPEMDGRKVFQELKRINKDIKAILVSGYNSDEIKNNILNEGFVGFVQKPYNAEHLLNTIRSL